VRVAEPVALVAVENHTDFEWRILFEPIADTPVTPAWRDVAPRAIVKIALAPGVYRARREISTEGAPSPPADDAYELKLEGGRTYEWPLATLFSSEGVER